MNKVQWPDPKSLNSAGQRKAAQVTTPHGTRRIEFSRKFQDRPYIAPREKPAAACATCGLEPSACRCAYAGNDCAVCGLGVWRCKCGQGE